MVNANEGSGRKMGLMSQLGYICKEEHEAALAHTYLRAYWEGYAAAKEEVILSSVTPNDIRKACGLEPIGGD